MAVIVKKPTQQQIDDYKYRPTWQASAFVGKRKLFTEDEFFIVAEGYATLHCEDQGDVSFQKGDFVLIQKGTTLFWDVPEFIKKYC